MKKIRCPDCGKIFDKGSSLLEESEKILKESGELMTFWDISRKLSEEWQFYSLSSLSHSFSNYVRFRKNEHNIRIKRIRSANTPLYYIENNDGEKKDEIRRDIRKATDKHKTQK